MSAGDDSDVVVHSERYRTMRHHPQPQYTDASETYFGLRSWLVKMICWTSTHSLMKHLKNRKHLQKLWSHNELSRPGETVTEIKYARAMTRELHL